MTGFRTEQVAVYQGANVQEAEDAFRSDVQRAVAAGFQPADADRREEGGRYILSITYRYQPPAVLVRAIAARNLGEASALLAGDAQAMARAGYILTAQSWGEGQSSMTGVVVLGLGGLAMRGAGTMSATYSYRPDMTGPPSAPLPPVPQPASGPNWSR